MDTFVVKYKIVRQTMITIITSVKILMILLRNYVITVMIYVDIITAIFTIIIVLIVLVVVIVVGV